MFTHKEFRSKGVEDIVSHVRTFPCPLVILHIKFLDVWSRPFDWHSYDHCLAQRPITALPSHKQVRITCVLQANEFHSPPLVRADDWSGWLKQALHIVMWTTFAAGVIMSYWTSQALWSARAESLSYNSMPFNLNHTTTVWAKESVGRSVLFDLMRPCPP